MEHRTLGNTGIAVSKICLGSMTWGEQNSEAEAHQQLDYALAHGVNFIDTAEMYPVPPNAQTYATTERYIGSWLKARGKRDDVVLASKIAGPPATIIWTATSVAATTSAASKFLPPAKPAYNASTPII